MYPRNATSPPRIAVGPVVQISDGAVQTSGASATVTPEGGSETAAEGTLACLATSGVWTYIPTQAETNYTAFVVAVYKAGCIPATVTVVTTAVATAGQVNLSMVKGRDVTDVGAGNTVYFGTAGWALGSDWTSGRAAKLDNIPAGTMPTQAEVLAIQNNTRVRVIVPPCIERPDSGSTAYRLWLYLYDEIGNMEAPDSTPTVTAQNNLGTDRSANLSAVSNPSTGVYYVDYTVASTHEIEGLLIEWTTIEGGVSRTHGAGALVVDTTAVDFTAADRTKLDALHDDRLTAARAGKLDHLDATITSRHEAGAAVAKSPATLDWAADVSNKTEVTAIKTKTDLIPGSPAAVGSAMTLASGAITASTIADGAITDAKFTVPEVSGVATGILGFIAQLWRRFFKKATMTTTQMKTFADDGTTVLTTQAVSDDGSVQTQGGAS